MSGCIFPTKGKRSTAVWIICLFGLFIKAKHALTLTRPNGRDEICPVKVPFSLNISHVPHLQWNRKTGELEKDLSLQNLPFRSSKEQYLHVKSTEASTINKDYFRRVLNPSRRQAGIQRKHVFSAYLISIFTCCTPLYLDESRIQIRCHLKVPLPDQLFHASQLQ